MEAYQLQEYKYLILFVRCTITKIKTSTKSWHALIFDFWFTSFCSCVFYMSQLAKQTALKITTGEGENNNKIMTFLLSMMSTKTLAFHLWIWMMDTLQIVKMKTVKKVNQTAMKIKYSVGQKGSFLNESCIFFTEQMRVEERTMDSVV